MRQCFRCYSFAINPGLVGRDHTSDLDLCDVCYWRKRAETTVITAASLIDDMKKEALKKPTLTVTRPPVVVKSTMYQIEVAHKLTPEDWNPYGNAFKAKSPEAALKVSEVTRKSMTSTVWSCRLMEVVTTRTEVLL